MMVSFIILFFNRTYCQNSVCGQEDRQTDKTTTVTLAARVCRGLIKNIRTSYTKSGFHLYRGGATLNQGFIQRGGATLNQGFIQRGGATLNQGFIQRGGLH